MIKFELTEDQASVLLLVVKQNVLATVNNKPANMNSLAAKNPDVKPEVLEAKYQEIVDSLIGIAKSLGIPMEELRGEK